MAYWLMKSEPDVFSFTDLTNKPVEEWHGVHNFTARNNMKLMKIGDLAFFYHSNIGKEIVGIMRVVKLAHPDSTAEPNASGKVVKPELRARYEQLTTAAGGETMR